MIPVILGVSIFVFFGMHMVPGDVAMLLLGDKATAEDLVRLRHELGLDQPVYVQYLRFMGRAIQGDFGVSLRTRQKAFTDLWDALPMTVELSVVAMALSVIVGVPMGVLAATKQYSLFDNVTMILALIGVSMPIFWTGIILMMFFGGHLHWLPIGGILSEGIVYKRVTGIHLLDGLLTGNLEVTKSAAEHLILPAIALGSIPLATIARMTRSAMLEIMRMDYVRTARAKGLVEGVVIFRHALRNALIPVVTMIGLELGMLLSGAVLTETVFALPGLGRLVITSLLARDYSVVQAAVMFIAVVIVFLNLLVDLLYAFLDPRIKYA